jgi:hypothetical protein
VRALKDTLTFACFSLLRDRTQGIFRHLEQNARTRANSFYAQEFAQRFCKAVLQSGSAKRFCKAVLQSGFRTLFCKKAPSCAYNTPLSAVNAKRFNR